MTGKIRLQPYSMGKGYVKWRVEYPPLAQKIRDLPREFSDLETATRELARHCQREQLDAETISIVETHYPGAWASGTSARRS